MKLSEDTFLKFVKGKVIRDAELKNFTTFKVGGKVDFLIIPQDEEDIRVTLSIARDKDIPLYIIGNGSNLLVSDEGVRGIVIRISKINFNRFNLKGSVLKSESGVLLSKLISYTVDQELSGMESLLGIPGTLGGAITMNAGTNGFSISQILREIKVMNKNGEIKAVEKEELGFSYRSSKIMEKKLIILEAVMELKKFKRDLINESLKRNFEKRKKTQPYSYPNAGCIFKNPEEKQAGWLIERAGCKGLRIGGAEVSTKHANFIVNRGNATFNDIIKLMELVRERVLFKFGIELKPEVLILGRSKGLPFKILEPW